MSETQYPTPIRIAVSRCLLGEKVRYDGDDRRDSIFVDTLGRRFQWLPLCPEVEIGLGIPRPKIQLQPLVENNERANDYTWCEYRLVMSHSGMDLTKKMLDHCRRLVEKLRSENVSGCILKSRSPSCGLSRVKVFYEDGTMRRQGVGLFAKTLMTIWPQLPVEENDRIQDPQVREDWIRRVMELALPNHR